MESLTKMESLCPIGSVVLLKDATKKTVIMGVMQIQTDGDGRVFDYLGVPYPEGYMGKGSSYLFNHNDIDQIIFQGYQDSERENFLTIIDTLQKTVDEALESKETND